MTGTMVDAERDVTRTEGAPRRAGGAGRMVAAELTMFTFLGMLALVAFRPVIGNARSFAVPVLGAVVVATALAAAFARLRVPARAAIVASLVVGAVYLSYTVLVDTLAGGIAPSADTVRGLRVGLTDGWSSMLDGSLPLGDDRAALVWLTALGWLAAHATADLVLRSRLVAVPLVPSLVVFMLALPVTAPTVEPGAGLVAALIAAALIAVLVRAAPDPRPSPGTPLNRATLAEFHTRAALGSRLAPGIPIVILAVLAAPLMATALTVREPYDPRSLRAEIVTTERVSDPLAQVKPLLTLPEPLPAFQVQFGGAQDALEVRRVGVVSLDRYDGVRWTTTGQYRAAGPVLTPEPAGPGRIIEQRYTIADLPHRWLPAAGQPERIELQAVGYDAEAGDLLAPGSTRGLTYSVWSRVAVPTAEQLASAVPESGDAADVELPDGTPEVFARLAAEATAGATTPAEALGLLERFLHDQFYPDDTATVGHSFGSLERFLTVDPRGTAEQFASAYAVMARTLGFPTRVVVGYRVVDTSGDAPAPLEFVTTAQYHAWVEVRFADLGWVAYDPTPAARGTPPPPPPQELPPAAAGTPAPSLGESQTPREAGPSEGLPDIERESRTTWVALARRALFVLGTVAAGAAALATAVLWVKARRRHHRRHAPLAADRVVGAWDEAVDRLSETGMAIGPNMTAADVARASRDRYVDDTMPLERLAPVVARAVYAADAPSTDLAAVAWQLTEQFETALAHQLNRRQRWAARLSVRPLRRRRQGVPASTTLQLSRR